MPDQDLYGEAYIREQMEKRDRNAASEGKFIRTISLFFALIGAAFLIFRHGTAGILFFVIAAVLFLTTLVHGNTSPLYFEAGRLADGRPFCPKCGSTEKDRMPPPVKRLAPSGKKARFGISPEEQYLNIIKNEYGVCRKCGTQYYAAPRRGCEANRR